MHNKSRSAIGSLIAIMNGAGSALIVVITLLICADIIGRGVFNSPVAGVAEMVSLSIVAIVFLQLAQAVRSNALARTDILLSAVEQKSPRLGALLHTIYDVIAALLFSALAYGSFARFLDAWSSNEHVGVYGLFTAPVWPVVAIVVLGSTIAVLQFILHAIRNVRVVFGKQGRSLS